MGFRRLVTVQFQAERIDADGFESFLHDLECRHFFGDKQHALALEQRIGDHVGDGLRLACSRRTMQDKAASPARINNSLKLRGVYIYGNGKISWRGCLIKLPGINLILSFRRQTHYLVACQCLYHRMFGKDVGMVVYVVPHDKLAEREQSQDGLIEHVPSWAFHNCRSDGSQHLQHVYPTVVGWQWIHARYGQLELLFDHLDKCDVDDGVLIARSDDISCAAVAFQVDWNHQDGRISRFDAPVGFIPFEYAQSQE